MQEASLFAARQLVWPILPQAPAGLSFGQASELPWSGQADRNAQLVSVQCSAELPAGC
jgi:hypothetical protein